MNFEDICERPQHHAYIIFGTVPEHVETNVHEERYVIRIGKHLSVEDVRWLHEYAHHSTDAPMRRVILEATGASVQAQNALLKILEEMQQGVYFFIVFPPGTAVLETLLSRCYVVENNGEDGNALSEHFTEFIGAAPKKRLAMIDTLWDRGEGVRHTAILALLRDAEIYLHTAIRTSGDADTVDRCRRAVEHLRDAVDHGALHKGTLQIFAFI